MNACAWFGLFFFLLIIFISVVTFIGMKLENNNETLHDITTK